MNRKQAIRRLSQSTGRPIAVVERDMKILRKMKYDPAYFAKVCFTKGEGWLYEPGTLAGFQEEVYDLIGQGHEKTLVLWPRGHMKTTLISKVYVIHQILFKHAEYVALFSSTERNKRGVATNHRQVFLDSMKFEELHYFLPYLIQGDKMIIKANETELVLGNGTRIEYVAISGENRGLSSAGRPDLVVMDDIISSDAAYSETVRDHITNTWFSVIRFIGRDGCRFLGVGTVLHKDDLWSKISDGRIGGWYHVRLRAYDPDVEEEERDKTVLWPERWSWAKLKRVYEEEYVADNKEYLWQREMLNDPATNQTNPFIDASFSHYSINPADSRVIYGGELISPGTMHRVIAVDHSQGTGNDDFVVLELGTDHRGVSYVLDAFVSNDATVTERIRAIKRMMFRRSPHKLVVERTTESMTFIDVLKSELRRAGFEVRIEEPTPQKFGAKNDRVTDRLLPKYDDGRLIHEAKSDFSVKLEDQLHRFDKTRKNNRDDIVDCLAWCVIFSKAPLPSEVEFQIPNDDLYNVRKRIHDKIEEQKLPDHILTEDESWPMVRGAW